MQHFRSLVPMAHVKSVSRSVAFYERLGFKVMNTFEPPERSEPSWASLESGNAVLMLALADEPVLPSQLAVLFYLYCEDIPAAHATFEKNGVTVGDITYPFFSPRGEFRITDPDGFAIIVAHT